MLQWRACQVAIPRVWWNVQHALPWATFAASPHLHHQHARLSDEAAPTLQHPSKAQLLDQLHILDPKKSDAGTVQHLMQQLAPLINTLTPRELIDTVCIAGRHASFSPSIKLDLAAYAAKVLPPLQHHPIAELTQHQLPLYAFITAIERLALAQVSPTWASLASSMLVARATSMAPHDLVQTLYALSRVWPLKRTLNEPGLVGCVHAAITSQKLWIIDANQLLWCVGFCVCLKSVVF